MEDFKSFADTFLVECNYAKVLADRYISAAEKKIGYMEKDVQRLRREQAKQVGLDKTKASSWNVRFWFKHDDRTFLFDCMEGSPFLRERRYKRPEDEV